MGNFLLVNQAANFRVSRSNFLDEHETNTVKTKDDSFPLISTYHKLYIFTQNHEL